MRPLAPLLLFQALSAHVDFLDVANRGFHHGFTDGQHGYLVPYINLEFTYACGDNQCHYRHDVLTRFGLQGFGNVEHLNLGKWGAMPLRGYIGGFAHGGYGYLVPHFDGSRYHGRVVRFNLTSFSDVEVLDLASTWQGLVGFFGGFTDGKYGYVAKWAGWGGAGIVARFNLQSFGTVEYINLRSKDSGVLGITGGCSDGTHGYVVAGQPLTNGRIVRFSLENFTLDSVEVLNLADFQANLVGYHDVFTDGTYGYAVPWHDGTGQHGRAVRFRLQTFGDIEVLDLTQFHPGLKGFLDGDATEDYGVMFPRSHGKIAVFDLGQFESAFAVDMAKTHSHLTHWYGGFTSGKYAFTVPYNFKVAGRVHLTTTTTTTTSTVSSTTTSTSSQSTTATSTRTTSSTSSRTRTSSSSSSSTTSVSTTSSSTSTSTRSSTTSSSKSSTSSSSSSSVSSTSSTITTTATSTSTTKSTTSSSSTSASSTSSSTMTRTSSSSSSSSDTSSTTTTSDVMGSGQPTERWEFSSSTTSNSLTSTLSFSTGTGTTTTTTKAANMASASAFAVQKAIGNSVAALLARNATSLRLTTDMGTVTVVDLSAALASVERATFGTDGGSKVSMSRDVLRSLPTGAVLAILDIKDEPKEESTEDEGPFAGLGALATKTLDISVHDSSGRKAEVSFEKPLLFKLPGSDGLQASNDEASCVYLELDDAGNAMWSTKGVRRATDAEVLAAGEMLGGVWCLTTHLSIFSALLQAVLGCTNLELLSPEALRAVRMHKGWYTAESAVIVFVVWSLLALIIGLGNLRECWALRLGRTHDSGKAVNICRSFMMWGPHVLKHRYAVFVVYAKDIFHCMTTHHAKLKNSSLTASVQRFLAVRTGISVACVAQHCWNGGAWIDSKASLPNTVLCRKLEFHAGVAERVILEDISMPGVCGMLRRFVLTVLAVHPLLDSMRVGAGSLTVSKRTVLQMANLSGVIATNALIFNFSGSLRSWEADAACPIDPQSKFFILVATLVSLLVNAVPNAFLLDLARQVHGRPLWNFIFWMWTTAYLSCAVLFIIVALSNLNPKDQEKWYASLEWGMSAKLIGMPLAQGIRSCVLLEVFLRHDRECKPCECFRVVMGLSHPKETSLSREAQKEAETMASQAISAAELLQFYSLLGQKVMLDFDPATCTSDDVMNGAILPFCVETPNLGEYPVKLEVLEVNGWPQRPRPLLCHILHLGELHHGERVCISEQCSQPMPVKGHDSCWILGVSASVTALLPEHALAFTVEEQDGPTLGIAWLSAQEVLQSAYWSGELALHPEEGGSKRSRVAPPEAGHVHVQNLETGLPPERLPPARMAVKIHVPEGYMKALAIHECHKLRSGRPDHESEVLEPLHHLQASLVRRHTSDATAEASPTTSINTGAFCEPCSTWLKGQPPEQMVVHSREGKFLHLVASVIADALGSEASYKAVEARLIERDFHGLLDMLREAGCQGTRYWIEMFAVNPMEHHQQGNPGAHNWHEDFLLSWPTVLRAMREASCRKAVADIEAGRRAKSPGPLLQLLVMDEKFHFLREKGCLAELMLARAMHMRQRLVLHPSHLTGKSLAGELHLLATELGKAYQSCQELLYTAPYLENRQEVYEAVRGLIVASLREEEGRGAAPTELDLAADLAAAAAMVRAQRSEPQDLSQMAGTDAADMDVDLA